MKTFYIPEDFVFNSVEECLEAYPDQAVSNLARAYDAEIVINTCRMVRIEYKKLEKKHQELREKYEELKFRMDGLEK